jgi:peptidyl-prolyl cis-trans isomerase B (cyclophilin B)
MAIASLVLAFLCSPAGIVCGIVALSQIGQRREAGRGLALAGIVLSVVFLVIGIAAVSSNSFP